MQPRWWQPVAVVSAIVLIALLAVDAAAGIFARGDAGFSAVPVPGTARDFEIRTIANPSTIRGDLRVGDRVALEDGSLLNRLRYERERPGDRFRFIGKHADGTPVGVDVTLASVPPQPQFWGFEFTGFAFAIVGLSVALRRPRDPVARTMVLFVVALGALFVAPVPWFPPAFTGAVVVLATACQIVCAYAALRLATTFPFVAIDGIRYRLARINPWLTIVALATIFSSQIFRLVLLLPPPPVLDALGIAETFAYFGMITVAFVAAGRQAEGADRKRLQWVAWTLAAGFSGTFVAAVQFSLRIPFAPWESVLGFTLTAVPIGLSYAIVRHRVVDVGFVINRAIVFGVLSGIVIVSFMVLEWGLSNAALRFSHVTSMSLELAIALGLGFGMRSLHSRVDRFIDDLFFRDRKRAEVALIDLARDVAYIGDGGVAVERVRDELIRRTGAEFVAIFIVDGSAATRVDVDRHDSGDASVDDAAFVRLRASRTTCDLASVPTRIRGDRAFPMFVRDRLIGAVVLGSKRNGEAFAPDEIVTVGVVANALGNALDSIQTAALKVRIERILAEGASIETLRNAVAPAAWLHEGMLHPKAFAGDLGSNA